MRPAAAVATVALIAGTVYGAVRFLAPSRARVGAPAASWRVEVETLARPAAAVGPAVDVAARGDVLATVWEDGSLTVRRAGALARTLPPSPDERLRRVAVAPDGAVLALTTRGRIVLVEGESAKDSGLRTQPGSRLAAGPGDADLWAAGEAGAVRRFDRVGKTVAEPWGSGAPPFRSLLVGPSHVLAGGVDGGVLRAPIGATTTSAWLRLEGGVTALAAVDGWVAAGTERGRIAVRRSRGAVPATVTEVDGAVAGIAFPPPDASGEVEREPLLVVHEPATATLLEGGGYERRVETPLGSTPRCACPLGDGGALLVGTDDGERIVRATAGR